MSGAPHTAASPALQAVRAPEACVDIAFEIRAPTLPAEHRAPLRDALAECLPSLFGDAGGAGVHPLKTLQLDGRSTPARRARLVLRVRASQVDDALGMRGRTLDLAGHPVEVGEARLRPLAPAPTIASAFVATMAQQSPAHERAVREMLERAGASAAFICGRSAALDAGDVRLSGASVVLHGLSAPESLRLQGCGLGPHRALGCGVFVPYKTIGGLDR